MSIYRKLAKVGPTLFKMQTLFKYGYNFSPMYRRTTARVLEVSEDIRLVKIKLPISYKNKNYLNSIFGGSMFSAVDPIPMVQLIQQLDDNYVVWDKSAEILFKRPAKEDLYATFIFTENEINEIIDQVAANDETEMVKTTELTNKDGTIVYCIIKKTIYIAEKEFFKQKQKEKSLVNK